MMKMKPRVLTEDQRKALASASVKQEKMTSAPKSTDPVNFPVFEVPVNAKVLIYVPNHVIQNPDGTEDLRMDKPLLHSVTEGKRYHYIRCISGIVNEELGYSGVCPICEGEAEPWDLASEVIKERCRQQGLNPEDKDSDSVKAIRSKAFSDRVIKGADRYVTFPIVVFETEDQEAKKLVKDENGLKYKVMWYHASESVYTKKWIKALESLDDEPNHPGGHVFILNYCYTPKSGEPNRRDSARELTVIPKTAKWLPQVAKVLDKETEGWDVAKAQETVITNQFYTEEDLSAMVDDVLQSTRERLALYDSINNSASKQVNGGNVKAISGFSLEESDSDDVDGGFSVGLTDEDID